MLYPQRGRTQLFQIIAAYIRDNALNQVTPADFRRVLRELVSSDWNRADDGTPGGGGGGVATQLVDFITLREAQDMLHATDPASGVQPSVLYVISGSMLAQWNGGNTSETVFVEGLVSAFAPTGWVDDGGAIKPADIDAAAGTWVLGGSALPARNIDEVPAAKALAVVAANVAALLETDTSYDGKSFLDDRDPNGIIFYWCRKARKVNPSDPQKLYWLRLPVL
ncbi:MAG: hypothetical protein ACRYFZ_09495 [Janthinobacterium lividum]